MSLSFGTSSPGLRRRGVVLIVVLVVIALLTLAALTFSELMLAERRAAHSSARQAQARALADSGVDMVRLFLSKDELSQDDAGGWYDNPQLFYGSAVIDDELGEDSSRFTVVAPALVDDLPAGVRFGLEDESTRLNLNVLLVAEASGQGGSGQGGSGQDESEEDGGEQGGGRGILMGLPGMTEEIADAILDWIDDDDEPREYGAEGEYYSALVPAYAPKNGPLDTLEELLLVRGVTPILLFGGDANRNLQLDSGELDPGNFQDFDNSDGSMDRGWAAYLTLYSKERNLNPDGEPKIDLNQDDMQELYDQLEEVLNSEWAAFIVAYRQFGPYTGSEPGTAVSVGQLDLKKEGQRKLETVLDLIGSQVRIELQGESEGEGGSDSGGRGSSGSSNRRIVLKSPFPDVPGLMDAYLSRLMDHVAVNTEPVIPGRININQASRVVLEGIPGLSDQAVDAILGQRQVDPFEAATDRQYETWILSQGIVKLDEMKKLIPLITGGGHVYRAQVIGHFDSGGPSVRVEIVLDATSQAVRVVRYRDLSHLGRGFSLQTPEMEAGE